MPFWIRNVYTQWNTKTTERGKHLPLEFVLPASSKESYVWKSNVFLIPDKTAHFHAYFVFLISKYLFCLLIMVDLISHIFLPIRTKSIDNRQHPTAFQFHGLGWVCCEKVYNQFGGRVYKWGEWFSTFCALFHEPTVFSTFLKGFRKKFRRRLFTALLCLRFCR